MAKQPLEAYVDTHSIFCPTCSRPQDEVLDFLRNLEDTVVVLRCPKCDTFMAAGYFVSFRAVCYYCGDLVVLS